MKSAGVRSGSICEELELAAYPLPNLLDSGRLSLDLRDYLLARGLTFQLVEN
jgi:hypothetical protein